MEDVILEILRQIIGTPWASLVMAILGAVMGWYTKHYREREDRAELQRRREADETEAPTF